MIVKPGDWVIVPARIEHGQGRRGEIISVPCATGKPPYTVRWLDTGATVRVVPGPDAVVVSAAERAELDRHAVEPIGSSNPSPPLRRQVSG